MAETYDITIVGAGPAGLYLTHLLEDRFHIALLEENSHPGGKPCTGLISKNLDQFLSPKESWIDNQVNSAFLHSPEDNIIKLQKPKTAAYVIHRKKFDLSLADKTQTIIRFHTRAQKITHRKDSVQVKTNREAFSSPILIGCDGANSVVRKHLGLKPRETVTGLKATTREEDHSNKVHLYFNKDFVEDGFLWKVPRGKATEYGALGTNISFSVLEKFFSMKDYKKEAALIPIGPTKTYSDRILLLGDAAGITKPWSGGGVIYAFTCAQIAADTVDQAFKNHDFSPDTLSNYEKKWKAKIGKNIDLGLMAREMLKDMDNQQLENFFRKLKQKTEKEDLSQVDMDFPFLNFL